MSRFKRENRYVVFKRKNLSHAQGKVLRSVESELWPDGNVKECLVVEHDWPCYDAAWNMIVKLSEGEFSDPYAEIKQLKQRCAELEKESMSFRAVLDKGTNFHPDTDPNYTQGFKDAMRLFEDIYLGEPHHALNKFAIEKKIEAIKLALDGERFELAGRPLDFGIRVESLELMLRDFEIGLNSMPIRKGGE